MTKLRGKKKPVGAEKSETLAMVSHKPPRDDRQRRREGEDGEDGNQQSKNFMCVKERRERGGHAGYITYSSLCKHKKMD